MKETWKEVTSREVEIGDVLRVKMDAYSTDAGVLHNGRLVEVTNVSNGDVFVKTIDNVVPGISEARHPVYKLEKRIG